MKYNFGQLLTNALNLSNATCPFVVQESALVVCLVIKATIFWPLRNDHASGP